MAKANQTNKQRRKCNKKYKKYTGYSESNTNPNPNPNQKLNYLYLSYIQMPKQQQQKIGIRKWTNTATKDSSLERSSPLW